MTPAIAPVNCSRGSDSGAGAIVPSLEPSQPLTGKPPYEVLSTAKELADRTVQIAGCTWKLPPDPGEAGPHPSLIFLIGAAIFSSESEMMKLADIGQWVRARYPCRPQSADTSIRKLLVREPDFMNACARLYGGRSGKWKLSNPQAFRRCYEEDIFLRHRRGAAFNDTALRDILLTAEGESSGAVSSQPELLVPGQLAAFGTDDDTRLAPELSVAFGDHILTLPPYSADQVRPPSKLLCGCAIALGSEHGSSVAEIAEWIAGRYSIQGKRAMRALRAEIGGVLRTFDDDFRRVDIPKRVKRAKASFGMDWMLKSPSAFAVGYQGDVYRCDYLAVASKQQDPDQLPSATAQDSSVSLNSAAEAVALPAAKKPADRTVQIAGFSWQLPPDPGEGGPYPRPAFLVGAAISSSERGVMRINEIVEWIRARYPTWPSASRSILSPLCRGADFINIRVAKRGRDGLWTLRNPLEFRGLYEENIFKGRYGIAPDNAHRDVRPAAEQTGSEEASLPTHPAPALSVKFGDYMLTLPPHRVDQRGPPLRLLCGCALALGCEQGSSVSEIAEWIAGRYSTRAKGAMKMLKANIRTTLNNYKSDFRQADNREHIGAASARCGIRWVLENPSAFAAIHGGRCHITAI